MPGVPFIPMERSEIEDLLMQQYGLSPNQAKQYAVELVGLPYAQQQLLDKKSIHEAADRAEADAHKMAPVAPTPLHAYATTPAHLQDANLSAWQRYSQMIGAPPQQPAPLTPKLKDTSSGQTSGKRTQGKK